MPGGDGTGPFGAGPMTGGGRGNCDIQIRGTVNRPFASRSFGRGYGYRSWCGIKSLWKRRFRDENRCYFRG